ncbi:hypothetical protein Ocin01_00280 [Orchesella cincta]|uniref:Deltamethrin resistance protein prag01 domain-containing protein n=1 Tax=Orchesella cincta TaxID=48709 RepID=A0A1D2NN58_ORCCI|nr:hypothetical protein Ocin01_00280 [Orchesella cincta]
MMTTARYVPIIPRLCRSVVERHQSFGSAGKRYYRKMPFVKPTLSELPVPEGCWERAYKRNNEKYNRHLLIGVSSLALAIFVISRVATFNFSYPAHPDVIDESCPVQPAPKKC